MAHWGYLYLNVFYGLAVTVAVVDSGSQTLSFLRSWPAAGIAAISYALYLSHQFVMREVFAIAGIPRVLDSGTAATLLLLSLTLSLLICALSYFAIERRCITYGHSFRFARQRPVPSPEADIISVKAVR